MIRCRRRMPQMFVLGLMAMGFQNGQSASDPTEGWSPYARNGDFLSSHLKSLRKFGYGMYVTQMQAADGPVCSTFWLYADAPAPGCMPEIAQLWRWNEFDFEFVPYTRVTQNSYITLDGAFPNPTVTYYGSELNLEHSGAQEIKPEAISWVAGRIMDDDTVFADMQRFYNRWMVNHSDTNVLISTNDFNYAGAARTTGPGHGVGGQWSNPSRLPGWTTAAGDWKYPLTAVKPVPDVSLLRRMATLNWWRTPPGQQRVTVNVPGFGPLTQEAIINLNFIAGSTATQSMTAATMNNETYVLPSATDYNPYTNLHAYTVVWTPTRVAFYIDAGPEGTNIADATPVESFVLSNFPSLSHSGPQAPNGRVPWVDTTLSDALGEVSINLANYVAFQTAKTLTNEVLTSNQLANAGWSGYPPGPNWAGADALVRSVKYFPLSSTNATGTSNADFDFASTNVWGFDLGDGTWTAANFPRRLGRYFGVIYAQDFTKDGIGVTNLRDSMSPVAITFEANTNGSLAADGKPVMKLACRPSDAAPKRNFFRLGLTMNTGVPISSDAPFMFASITLDDTVTGVSGASTPLAFFAPPPGTSVVATVKLYLSSVYHGSFPSNAIPSQPNATATLRLSTDVSGLISWSIIEDSHNIISMFQSQNPHMITVTRGSAMARAYRDCDFDGDSKVDPAVYHAGSGQWAVLLSGQNYALATMGLGGVDFVPTPEDYDGDGKADLAVYQELTGLWALWVSGSQYIVALGGPGCKPTPEDYDGDGKADPAVYQEASGCWSVLLSGRGYQTAFLTFGGPGYLAVPDDYDGDGHSDPAVYGSQTGQWYVQLSGSGYALATVTLGGPDYGPALGDYDVDGLTDPAVYDPGTGIWAVLLSGQNYAMTVLTFGGSGYLPVPGDYDGDGHEAPVVYDAASGRWWLMLSDSDYGMTQASLGGPGYLPVKPTH